MDFSRLSVIMKTSLQRPPRFWKPRRSGFRFTINYNFCIFSRLKTFSGVQKSDPLIFCTPDLWNFSICWYFKKILLQVRIIFKGRPGAWKGCHLQAVVLLQDVSRHLIMIHHVLSEEIKENEKNFCCKWTVENGGTYFGNQGACW